MMTPKHLLHHHVSIFPRFGWRQGRAIHGFRLPDVLGGHQYNLWVGPVAIQLHSWQGARALRRYIKEHQ